MPTSNVGDRHGFLDIPRHVITMDEARERELPGWNIRCNRCGDYGAEWLRGERPGWGALALCPICAAVFKMAKKALDELRVVRYEQERDTARRKWSHEGVEE